MDLSRNWGLISGETQKKIENSTILCAGCGLGALVAIVAARVGFKNFILADGDKVEVSNFNRQPFFVEHLGRNKAEVTAELIKTINPEANVEVIPHFLRTREELIPLVKKSDFIINAVDPDETFWELTEITRKFKKIELHPLNVGWYSFVYVSLPDGPSLEEIIGKVQGFEVFRKLVTTLAPSITLPPPVIERLEEIGEGKIPCPQVVTTSVVTAASVVRIMIKILAREPLPSNPVVIEI